MGETPFLYIPYIYPVPSSKQIYMYPPSGNQRVGITSKGPSRPPPRTVNHMPRSRQIGITDELKSKIYRWERLPSNIKKNVMYDVRKILDKELEDIEWLLTTCPDDFLSSHDRDFVYPIEAILPSSAVGKVRAIRRIEGWIETLEQIILSYKLWGAGFRRTGRL